MLRYFMAHHRKIDALVLDVDERWCTHDPSLPIILPFPFWLYRGDLEYLANLLSTRAITFGARRVKMALGLVEPDDARGYQDYETGHVRNFRPRAKPRPAPSRSSLPSIRRFPASISSIPCLRSCRRRPAWCS